MAHEMSLTLDSNHLQWLGCLLRLGHVWATDSLQLSFKTGFVL